MWVDPFHSIPSPLAFLTKEENWVLSIETMESVKATLWRGNQAQAARWNKLRARRTASTELLGCRCRWCCCFSLLSGAQITVTGFFFSFEVKTGDMWSKDDDFVISATGSRKHLSRT